MLKVNGRCAVVLPNGKELFSKGNELVAVREYLMKTCDLKEIYYLPPVFTHTTISTCVFNFIKKKECIDALETKIKISKTQKEIGREYNFTKTHQTNKVKFYNYNPENEIKHLIIEVPIEKISKNCYSLNYAEYLKDDIEEEQYEDGILMKTLGEVCDIDKKVKKHPTEYGKAVGKYKFYTGGVRTDLYVDNYDIEELYIIQNRTNGSGKCNLFLDKKFSLAKQTMVYTAKNKNEITTKYIYYYLNANISILEKGFIGANHKNISHDYLENLKIPIPSLERQTEIVKYLSDIDTKNKQLEKEIDNNKRLAQQFITGIVKLQDQPIIDDELVNKVVIESNIKKVKNNTV
jgi:hypothetical protein